MVLMLLSACGPVRSFGTAPASASTHTSLIAASVRRTLLVLPPGLHPVAAVGQPAGRAPSTGSQVLYGIACPNVELCVAVGMSGGNDQGNEVLVTNDGGANWKSAARVAEPAGSGASDRLMGVSCPNPTLCVAVGEESLGNEILISTDMGMDWVSVPDVPQPPSNTGLLSVSCANTSLCVAVGGSGPTSNEILRTTDGGSHWSMAQTIPQTSPSGEATAGLASVSCPSPTLCVAVGSFISTTVPGQGEILRSTDGGNTWAVAVGVPNLHQGASLTSVHCATITLCVAMGAGNVSLRSTDGGNHWAVVSIPGTALPYGSSVACASATACIAIWGGAPSAIFRTTTQGTRWIRVPTPQLGTNLELYAASCPSPTTCLAVGADSGSLLTNAIVLGTEAGDHWRTVHQVPQPAGTSMVSGNQALRAISCGSPTDCIAVGMSVHAGISSSMVNEVLHTTNGGRTWNVVLHVPQPQADAVEPGDQWLASASCPSPTLCIAVGQENTYLGNPSDQILVSGDGGNTWAAIPGLPTDTEGEALRGVSCGSTTNCVAVGYAFNASFVAEDQILVSTDGGLLWSAATPLPASGNSGGQVLNAVDCAENNCVAVGSTFGETGQKNLILESINGGRTWTRVATVPEPSSAPLLADQALDAVSCAAQHCVAVGDQVTASGQQFQAMQRNGADGTWQVATDLPQSTGTTADAVLHAVVCQPQRCWALGSWDTAAGVQDALLSSPNNGRAWSIEGPTSTPTTYQSLALSALACPTTGSCLVAGSLSFGIGSLNIILATGSPQPTSPEPQAPPTATTQGGFGGITPLPASALPAPWSLIPDTPAVPFGTQAFAVELERIVAPPSNGAEGTLGPDNAIGVWEGNRWSVFPLPNGSVPYLLRAVFPGSFAAYSDQWVGGVLLRSTLEIYRDGALLPVPLPPGQFPTSLLGLPSGATAIGTGFFAQCGPSGICPATRCPQGQLLLLQGGHLVQQVPPAPSPTQSTVETVAPPWGFDGGPGPVCPLTLQSLGNGILYFSMEGIGLGGYNLTTHTFVGLAAPGEGFYAPASAGPVNVIGVTPSTVVFDIGTGADGTTGSGVQSVPSSGGIVRIDSPSPPECVASEGAGPPQTALLVGSRIWADWSGCPLYDGTTRDDTLVVAPSTCAAVAVLTVGTQVVAECPNGNLLVYDGATGALTASEPWPTSLQTLGITPDASSSLMAGSGDTVWVQSAVTNGLVLAAWNIQSGSILTHFTAPADAIVVPSGPSLWVFADQAVAEASVSPAEAAGSVAASAGEGLGTGHAPVQR